jgi:hypothetical protein
MMRCSEPAIASRLQLLRPAGLVAELGSLFRLRPVGWHQWDPANETAQVGFLRQLRTL